ncbi:sugar ABC transporter substrate-binding protein [Chloroflexi bacterium TSY]|nr:sugar ABC transporter substrate-binding protein [Chloroflexi bacterium TSY]
MRQRLGLVYQVADAPAAPASTDAGASAPAGEVVTLTMWKGPHKAAGDETKLCAQPTLDVLQEMYPEVIVDFSEIPWGQYNEKFTAAFAADTGPDVSYQTESFPRFVNAGHIMALDDMIESSGFDRAFFYERAWEPGTYDGTTYSLPWIIGGSNLFWNKDLFEQAGLDPDTPPDTVEEFLSHAQAITELDENVYGFASTPKDWHENSQWPRRFGGRWFNDDLTECIINSPEAMEGWNFLDALYHEYEVAMPGAISGQEPGVGGYFRDGQVGMITAQNVFANSVRSEKPDFNLGAARMATGPAEGARGRACYGGVGMLAIANKTAHPQEAWTVVETLVTPELLTSWIGCLGFMSVAPSVNFYPDDEVLTTAQDTLQYTFFWPYRGWIFKFWDIESTSIESFILGQRSVEEAVEDLVVQLNDLLQEEEGA